jgi:formylglycine-generating enzyme
MTHIATRRVLDHATWLVAAGFWLMLAGPAAAHAQDKAAHAPEVDLSTMVELEAGQFTMGTSLDEEVGRYGDRWFVNEQPAHPVELDAFRLDALEVSVGDFALFLSYAGGDYHFHPDQPIERVEHGYLPVDGAADEPIRMVTWEAADHHCKWAGKRLPTEAEWEYAAAGAEGREFPWGDQGRGCPAVNYFAGASFCEQGVLAVGSLAEGATPEGVFDMAGNVAEWVADWYARYPQDAQARSNPAGPDVGELRVVRGGGHLSRGRWRRTRARFGADPSRRSRNIGFRCAWDSQPQDAAVRGPLSPPDDVSREQRERPRVAAAERPAIVSERLDRPGAMVAAGDEWFVLERGQGSVLAIDPADWTRRVVVASLDEPADLAGDGATLFVADAGAESVIEVDPLTGDMTVLSDDEPDARALAVDADGVAWFSGSSLRYFDRQKQQVHEVITDIDGPVWLALAGSTIAFTTDGDGDPDKTTLSLVDVDDASSVQVLLDQETFGEATHPNHVLLDAANQRLWFVMRYRGFPNNGSIVRIELQDGSGAIETYTPRPHSARLLLVDETVYLPLRNSLLAYNHRDDATFETLTPFTRPGGVIVGADFVVWSDEQDGRVYHLQRPQ